MKGCAVPLKVFHYEAFVRLDFGGSGCNVSRYANFDRSLDR
jgi:hypothetical protein